MQQNDFDDPHETETARSGPGSRVERLSTRLPWPVRRALAPLTFLLAGLAAWMVATQLADTAQRMTAAEVDSGLASAGIGWVEASVDGLNVHLTGTAPNEGARLAAIRALSSVVGAGRLSDDIEVPRDRGIVAPVFRIEAMRNHDDISLIGLVPLSMGDEAVVERMAAISDRFEVADMLQSADHPAPPGWEAAVEFAAEALTRLPVAQISIAAGRIEVHALVDSPEDRARLNRELRALTPRGQVLALDLVAPRPVIAPFLLRLSRDADSTRFETCAADSETALAVIERAARGAGMTGRFVCTIGLGAPSPLWGQAAERAIAALGRLPAGSVTMSDNSVILQAPHDTDPGLFDRTVGRLESELPDAFALTATILPPPEDETGPAAVRPEFRVTLSAEGEVEIAGRLPDPLIRQAVEGYARARFGSDAVNMEARLDPDLPEGWSLRVLAGLTAMTELHHGSLLVTDRRLELIGVSGNSDVASEVSGILNARLGSVEGMALRVEYDEALDPAAQEPTPERCERWVRAVLAERKVTFDPGSARLDSQSNAVMDELAEILRNCGEMALEVAGHTDSQGGAEANMRLSQNRAEAVLAALSTRGVLTASMVAQGYGEERPIADNATAEGREQNRRIEISLILPTIAPDELDDETLAEMEAGLEFEALVPSSEQTRPVPRPQRSDD